MSGKREQILTGTLLDDEDRLTLDELCRLVRLQRDEIVAMVEEGILEPEGDRPVSWRFQGVCVQHVHIVTRLRRDLGVNLAGAALVLELLDRLRSS